MKKLIVLFYFIVIMITICFSQDSRKIYDDGGFIDFPVSQYNEYIQNELGTNYYILPKSRIKVEASSYLKDKKYSYPPENVIDGDINTAWVEGVDGFGKDEWIKLTIDLSGLKKHSHIAKIIILPGYGKSEVDFKKNNRLKTILLKNDLDVYYLKKEFEDKYAYHFTTLSKTYDKKQIITIFIEDVYKGSKYDDTCIGEIFIVMGKPPKIIDG